MRNVHIGTVSFLVDDAPHSIAGNVRRAVDYIAQASRAGCDLVLLPEMFRTVQIPEGEITPDEQWSDGETTQALSGAAVAHGINVAATWYVQVERRIYNQTTVIGRDGAVAGYYRKAQPTGSEIDRVSAGNSFPVIELDVGRVGVMICLDIYFPEIARIYAMQGADILLWPTVTLGPTQDGLLAQARSRAIDNGLLVVESNMATAPPYAPYAGRSRPGTARIIDHAGEILASTGRRPGVAHAVVDLDQPRITSMVVMMREPEDMRRDLESITRLDLYAREYARLAAHHSIDPRYRQGLTDQSDYTDETI